MRKHSRKIIREGHKSRNPPRVTVVGQIYQALLTQPLNRSREEGGEAPLWVKLSHYYLL